jgi:DNA-binding NtrC family response regulator
MSKPADLRAILDLEKPTLAEIEEIVILDAIKRHSGNKSDAALELGIGRSTLYRKLREWENEE